MAARTRTSKRMIHYCFGSKEEFYLAVLEEAYGAIGRTEATPDLDALAPEAALRNWLARPSTTTRSIPSSRGW